MEPELVNIPPDEELYANIEQESKLLDALNSRTHGLISDRVTIVMWETYDDPDFGNCIFLRAFKKYSDAIEWGYRIIANRVEGSPKNPPFVHKELSVLQAHNAGYKNGFFYVHENAPIQGWSE